MLPEVAVVLILGLKLAFVRNVIYKGRGHGHGFQISVHSKYFKEHGIEIVENEKDANVLFSFDFSPKIIISALRARIRGKRFFVLCIGKLSEDQRWINRLAINILANRIHVLSRLMINKFIFKSKVEYVPMGVDLEVFRSSNVKKENQILSVGIVEPRKNYEQVIEIAKSFPKIKFKIVGIINNEEYFRHLQSKKPKNVEFLGEINVKKLVDLYRKSKILVHCSKYEMFSGVLQEALACGTPVVSLYHVNTKSNFGKNIVYARNTGEFVKKIDELLNNKNYYQKTIINGSRFIKNYPLSVLVKKNYEAVVGEK